ncbi:hypothetical protein [Cohnella sp. GCM10012308]|uniref:hypothetical protein n=1 Tax=Cohnella sp. GCM10012308 TaxID=3317329 RepID=UPI003606CC36
MAEQITDVFAWDDLFAGPPHIAAKGVVISGAGTYKRGQILQYVSTDAAGVDTVKAYVGGTNDAPYAILADPVVVVTTTARASAYLSGEYNLAALRIDGTIAVKDHVEKLRKVGLIVKTVVK